MSPISAPPQRQRQLLLELVNRGGLKRIGHSAFGCVIQDCGASSSSHETLHYGVQSRE